MPPPPPISCALKVLDLDALAPSFTCTPPARNNSDVPFKTPKCSTCTWVMGRRPQAAYCFASHEQGKCRRRDALWLAWWYGRRCHPLYIASSTTRIEVRPTSYGGFFFHPQLSLPSYLHINGFIHRDVKAANLLIDDDGTVLLGDLGVAADLAEDTSQLLGASQSTLLSQTDRGHGSADAHNTAKRVVLFDHTVPVFERPRMGKRKSFVGTVCNLPSAALVILFSAAIPSPVGWHQS